MELGPNHTTTKTICQARTEIVGNVYASYVNFKAKSLPVFNGKGPCRAEGWSEGESDAAWTPLSEVLATLSRICGPSLEVLDTEGWKELLDGSGLEDVVATSRGITVRSETVNRFRRVGLKEIAITSLRGLSIILRGSEYRRFLKDTLSDTKGTERPSHSPGTAEQRAKGERVRRPQCGRNLWHAPSR